MFVFIALAAYNVIMDTRSRSIGDKVRELRKGRDWTQHKLSEKAGVTEQTVYNLENGRHVPDTSTLLKIADGLDVSLADLLG